MLIANQGVIIPDLGGFISEYEPACFDVNENKFLPPSNKILFKPEYSYQDNLLVDLISEKENLNKEEANKRLKDFVEDLISKLKKGEKIAFPEVGTLSHDVKGNIVFIQTKESNLLPNSFGLKSIKSKPIVNHLKETRVSAPLHQKKSYKKLIIISSSVILILTVIFASWYLTDGFSNLKSISSNDINTETSRNLDIINTTERNLDSIAKADSIKAIINQSIDENTDKKDALFYSKPEEEQTKEAKSQYSKFYIIAGSFKRIENAEKYAEGIRSKGYETEIIKSDKNLIRISIYTFTDETSALKELYKLREKADLKSVWILKVI